MAIDNVLTDMNKQKGKMPRIRLSAGKGSSTNSWNPPLSEEKIADLIEIVSGYGLTDRQRMLFADFATGLRENQYAFFRRAENKTFVKMLAHSFDKTATSHVVKNTELSMSSFVSPNGTIHFSKEGYHFEPTVTIGANGKKRTSKFEMADAYVIGAHALTSGAKDIYLEESARERRMIQNAISKLSDHIPPRARPEVHGKTNTYLNMGSDFMVDMFEPEKSAFKKLFGKPPIYREKFEWKNPFKAILDIVWAPLASAFSSSRSIKTPVAVAPASAVKPSLKLVSDSDSAADAVVTEALVTINNTKQAGPDNAKAALDKLIAAVEASAHEPVSTPAEPEIEGSELAALDEEQESALNVSYAEIVTPVGSYMSEDELAAFMNENGVEISESSPALESFKAVGLAMIEVRDSAKAGTFEYDRSTLEAYTPTPEPEQTPQAEEPQDETPPPVAVAEVAPAPAAVVEIPEKKVELRITGLSRVTKQLVTNLVCQNPGMFEGQSVQSLNAVISAIPGLENHDNTKICAAVAKEMQNRGLVKLDEVDGDLVIAKVVSVVSPNKYFNTLLAQSVAAHKDFWVGQDVASVRAAVQEYWNMDEDAASYIADGIWKEMGERNVFTFDAQGKVERVADISNVPPLRQAYSTAAKMPPVVKAVVSEQVKAFDASAQIPSVSDSHNDDLVDPVLIAQAANDHGRHEVRAFAAE